ncbi:hypothetical protein OGM63_21345 [Plectonema radiosum NIES-515]|uniref:Uncharacterized protein n=1 Tax=Plectonema radiosum NIES-515 TaxID=2986073 RepID=A0ABT3B3S3_9CYAN|nr:hypothetical protein [Plectonema radiosum]MCV3216023.1 hypothetical protein [Plectonema radiosum NIES-515]
MKLPENFKRSHLLLRIWLWAAVRSTEFHNCQLCLQSPLIEVKLPENTCRYGYLQFEITINRPMLMIVTPWEVCLDFAHARKQVGEIIDLHPVNDVPF